MVINRAQDLKGGKLKFFFEYISRLSRCACVHKVKALPAQNCAGLSPGAHITASAHVYMQTNIAPFNTRAAAAFRTRHAFCAIVFEWGFQHQGIFHTHKTRARAINELFHINRMDL